MTVAREAIARQVEAFKAERATFEEAKESLRRIAQANKDKEEELQQQQERLKTAIEALKKQQQVRVLSSLSESPICSCLSASCIGRSIFGLALGPFLASLKIALG